MAENEVEYPALGVAWDGTGYGTDGTIWGGEFFVAKEDSSFERIAHLRQFQLPGGEAAIGEPRRCALGALYELGAKHLDATDLPPLRDIDAAELKLIRQILAKRVQAPMTSSAGSLFDAVASLAGIRQQISFDAQAAMELEFAIQPCVCESYTFEIKGISPCEIDWRPMLSEIVNDVREGLTANIISAKFHNALVEIIIAVARLAGQTRVVLSGGCFQNRYLTERTVQRLIEAGFRPYWHQRIPTNDGGIALGQIVDAARRTTPPIATGAKTVAKPSKEEIFA
jgi:hydrogenase maturation protein HypF